MKAGAGLLGICPMCDNAGGSAYPKYDSARTLGAVMSIQCVRYLVRRLAGFASAGFLLLALTAVGDK